MTQIQTAAMFGGATIAPAALARTAQQSQSQYVAIIASDGRVLAATPGAPRQSLSAAPYVAKALRTGSIQLSNLVPGPGGATGVASSSPRSAHSCSRGSWAVF